MKNYYQNLVFVERRSSAAAFIKRFEGQDTLFASIDEYIISELQRAGCDCLWLPSLLNSEELKMIDEKAWTAASTSFTGHEKLQNLLSYRDIRIGSCGILQMNNCFVWALKIHFAIQKLLSTIRVENIYALKQRRKKKFTTLEPSCEDLLCQKSCQLQGRAVIGVDLSEQASAVDFKVRWVELAKSLLRSFAYFLNFPSRNFSHNTSAKPPILLSGAPQQILELMPYLESRYQIVYVDLDYRLAKAPLLHKRKIPYFSFRQTCLFTNFWRRLKNSGRRASMRKLAGQAKELLLNEKILNFQNQNFFLLLEDYFDYFLKEWLEERRDYCDFFIPLLKQNHIQSLVLDEDTLSFKKTLVLVAKKIGLSSMVICHNSTPTFLGHELAPLTADWMVVGGHYIRDNFSEIGIPKERIIVSGLPRYDQISLQKTRYSNQQIRDFLGITKNTPMVTLASSLHLSHRNTTRSWWELRQALADTMTILRDYSEHTLVIKLHPLTDEYHCRELDRLIKAERPERTLVIKDIDAPSLFNASAFVLTFFSSVITENLLLGKPTILLDYFENEKLNRFIKQDSLFVAADRQSLKRAMTALLESDETAIGEFENFKNKLMQDWASQQDGSSAARIAEFISKMTYDTIKK